MTVPIQIHKATSSSCDVKCRLEYPRLLGLLLRCAENSYYSVFSRREILRRGRIKIPVPKLVKLKSLKTFNLEHVDLSFDFSVNMVLLPYPPALMYLSVLIVGVIKTHQLTYSPTQTLYAISNRDECTQHFTIHSRLAKDYLEYFQSRIEEVDLYVDGDKLIFNGFTEGFTGEDNRIPRLPSLVGILILELLKQPLQTQVSLSTGELEDFQFQERTHILLPLRDFKVFTIQRGLVG
jgi:hypothetical protein